MTRKTTSVANNLLRFTVCRNHKIMVAVYKDLIGPIIEYVFCLCNSCRITNLNLLEKNYWNNLSEEVADSPFLQTYKSIIKERILSMPFNLLIKEADRCW